MKRYIDALNARDRDAIGELFAADCRFVDSRGEWIEGREELLTATDRFFDLDSGFQLLPEAITAHGREVLVRGETRAADDRLAQDTLWLARVRRGKLTYWQSFGYGDPPALARMLLPEAAHVEELPQEHALPS